MNTTYLSGLLLVLCLLSSGCVPLRFRCYDGGYAGLGRRIEQSATNNARTHVVLVHGMTDHCPGYGDTFADNLAKRLHVTKREDEKYVDLPLPEANATNVLRTFSYSAGSTQVLFYELTWTPTTYALKTNAFIEDRRLTSRRVIVNRQLKEKVIDEGFGDAVLYLNPSFQTNMQKPIRQTIDYVMKEMGTNDRIVLVASSLGSKMTFDTVEQWRSANTEEFAGRTTDIIMLANQVPLLNLGSREIKDGRIVEPTNSLRSFLIRSQRRKAQKIREQKAAGESTTAIITNRIHVIAATDPNDMLSFPLRDRDIPDPEFVDGRRIDVVGVNIYSHNAWSIPWLFENPLPAHTGYEDNGWLMDRLVRGFNSKGRRCLPAPEPLEPQCDENRGTKAGKAQRKF